MNKQIETGHRLRHGIQRLLLALTLLTACFAAGAQVLPPDPGTRHVVFAANGGVFATSKTPGEYSAGNTVFTVTNVGLKESALITRYVPQVATPPENKVIDYWYTTASGTGGSKVNDATVLESGSGVFSIYAIWKQDVVISINTQPAGGNTTYGTGMKLTVAASAKDAGGTPVTPAYQWYSSTSAVNTSGTKIDGATSDTYTTPATPKVGTYFYYCEVSATKNGVTVKVASNAVTVAVVKKVLSNFDVLKKTKEYDGSSTINVGAVVFSGKVEPDEVGILSSGASFAGPNVGRGKTITVGGLSLDGSQKDNYTLNGVTSFTVADGSITPRVTPLGKDDFKVTVSSPFHYGDKPAGKVTVSFKDGISGGGTISVKLCQKGVEVTTDPLPAGTYDIVISTAGATNYPDVTNLTVGEAVITPATPVLGNFTLSVPAGMKYGDPLAGIKVSVKDGTEGMGAIDPAYVFKQGGSAVATRPLPSGTYDVCIKVAAGTNFAAVDDLKVGEATIAKIGADAFTAEDFAITLPGNLTYKAGEAKAATAEAKIKGLGAVTVEYKKIPGGETVASPTDAGSYELVIKVAASTNNEAATIEKAGIMTIAKAPQAQPSGVTAENATSGNNGKITHVDNKMEYRGIGETVYKEITGVEVTDLASGIYYVRLKGDANHLPGADLSITVAPSATPVYTVSFISEGTTKFAEQSVKKDGKAVKPATDPVRTNFTFAGWKKAATDGADAFDFSLPITENTTVYAGWNANPVYDVTGTVTDSEDTPNPLANISIVIHPLGATATTGSDGKFTLSHVPAGSYNLIATDANGNSVTLFITVTEDTTIDQPIRINGKANSKLVVEAGAPEVVVDKLDELAVKEQNGGSDNVLIKLVASPRTEDTAEGADDIKNAMASDGMRMSAILDLSLFKKVNDEVPVKMEELTTSKIEVIIPIPDSLRGNKDFALYRYHAPTAGKTEVHMITTTANADGEKIVMAADRSYLTATLKKFSSYALGSVPMHTVSYMLDAVTVFASESVADQGLAKKPSPDPVKSGYTLEAWCKDTNGTQPWNFASDKVAGNLSLYPKWKANPTPTPDPPVPPVPPVGVEDVDRDGMQVYGSTGAIVIEGATGVYRVVSLSGSFMVSGVIRDDRMLVSAHAGIYIVVLEDKRFKVVVR